MSLIDKYCLCLLISIITFWGCTNEDPVESQNSFTTPGPSDNSWLISFSEVVDGGPGRDGIPSIDQPIFNDAGSITYMEEQDLVLGIKVGNEIRAYSHPVLDWHEIVNDQIESLSVTITYCPLTGTGIGWNRKIKNVVTEFGVSGLLYRNNLIPYDRNSNSHWSQIRMEAVQGPLKSYKTDTYPLVEMTWSLWKKVFPDSKIITTQTGFSRSYGTYPYGNYKQSSSLLFPIGIEDDRLQRKERVLGVVIDEKAKVFRFKSFENGTTVILDTFQQRSIVVVGSGQDNFMMAYEINPEYTIKDFEGMEIQEGGAVMSDNLGNVWTIFGEAISGPLAGSQLNTLDAFMGYWFAFGAFYPKPQIYE